MTKPNTTDYTGQIFSDLTAVEYVGPIQVGKKPKYVIAWKFQCVCGSNVVYPLHLVLSGHNLSCGCRRSRETHKVKLCVQCGEPSFRVNRHGNPCELCHSCHSKKVNTHHKQNDDPRSKLVNGARSRAKKEGLPFDLTPADITIPDFCPVLGIPIQSAVGTCAENSPTLDKIVPEKGYVAGNVAVISWRANTIKSCGTVDEHLKVAAWMDDVIKTPPSVDPHRTTAQQFQSPEFRSKRLSASQHRRRTREREAQEKATPRLVTEDAA